VRVAAAQALSQVNPEDAETALLAALSDRSVKVIAAALQGLWRTPDPLPRLLDVVVPHLRHPHLDVRAASARLLISWRVGAPELVPTYLAAITREPSFDQRRALALLLARVGRDAAIPAVLDEMLRLVDDTLADPNVVGDTAWFALGQMHAAEVLVTLTDPDRYPMDAQRYAACALCRCDDPRWLPDILAVLVRTSSDVDRRAIIQEIGFQLGDRAQSVGPIIARFARHPNTRHEATEALSLIGATTALIELLRDEEDMTRGEAAHAINRRHSHQLDPTQTVPAMVNALSDSTDRVRRSAAEFLRSHRDEPGVMKALIMALDREEHMLTRQRLVEAVQEAR